MTAIFGPVRNIGTPHHLLAANRDGDYIGILEHFGCYTRLSFIIADKGTDVSTATFTFVWPSQRPRHL